MKRIEPSGLDKEDLKVYKVHEYILPFLYQKCLPLDTVQYIEISISKSMQLTTLARKGQTSLTMIQQDSC